MSITFMLLAASAASHSVPIEHHGNSMQATYMARADVEARTVGAKAGTRMDGQRCNWTANVVVDRKLDHSPALARTLSSDTRFTGSEHGACPRGDGLKKRVVARHQDKIHATLMATAQQDRGTLMAELDQARALASN